MSKEYKALDLAKYIVQKCIDDDCPISHLQLQKILYFIQEAFLRNGHPAFPDPIEAWQFGSVVPIVYNKYRIYGGKTIVWIPDTFKDVSWEDMELINGIVHEKRKLDPWEMVQETHRDGGAWAETYDEGKGRHKEIPIETIKKFLQKKQIPTKYGR